MIEGVRVLQRGGADGPISVEEAKRAAIENARDLPLREHGIEGGKAGPGRGKKTPTVGSRFSYGGNPDYLAARLKRDVRDLAKHGTN
ncbi:MAG: hypothetical protein ACJ8AW_51325 [Rhodopila sp.]